MPFLHPCLGQYHQERCKGSPSNGLAQTKFNQQNVLSTDGNTLKNRSNNNKKEVDKMADHADILDEIAPGFFDGSWSKEDDNILDETWDDDDITFS